MPLAGRGQPFIQIFNPLLRFSCNRARRRTVVGCTMSLQLPLFVALALFSPLSSAAQSHSLLPSVKVGDHFLYDFESTMSTPTATTKMKVQTDMSVISLEPAGTITFKNDAKHRVISQGEKVRELPNAISTTKFKLDGELLSVTPSPATPEQARFSSMMQMRVPTGPVKVNQTWTWTEEPADSIGRSAKCQCMAFETHRGVECAKVHYSIKETSGDTPATEEMDVWFSLKDGIPVEIVVDLANAPLAPGVTAKFHATNVRKSDR